MRTIFVVLVIGTRDDAEERRAEVEAVLTEIGLRQNDDKTRGRSDRRGLRLPRVPYTTGPEARQREGLYLHLLLQGVGRLDQEEDQGHHPPDHQPKPQNTYYGNSTRY